MTPEQQLDIISQAWGRQSGYCFFPWIPGNTKSREERIRGFREDKAFFWPKDKAKIVEHMKLHTNDDLYWCPSLFEAKRRKLEVAMDEHCLWADLDEVDPKDIDEQYKPTIAWETSPGRYQAVWLIQRGYDIQGASWRGGENHRLTHYLGADPSGWDTTQLLRIPEWTNHKFNYRDDKGNSPAGRLLWFERGRRYLPDHFEDIPEVAGELGQLTDVLDEQVEGVDRHEIWGKVRLKVNKAVRDYMGAREASGDRSEVLWQIERELADAGCTVVEIVALVRPTPWNKFQGRADELRRLTNEAAKAVAERPDEVKDQLETEAKRPKPQRFGLLIKNIPKPEWVVEGIWSRGACGFIAGQPKSFKSWTALDLALSVPTGMDFLGHFPVKIPGPTLYIQEEDGLAILKQRADKIWPGKQADRMQLQDGSLVWDAAQDMGAIEDVPMDAYVREGFTLSDPSWQSWLDEALADGEYVMAILDPLMMMSGEVEENRAQDMTSKIFRPLKQLAEKHKTAIVLVHHMRKLGNTTGEVRGGQMMLGSVANHAWSEDSLYLKLSRGDVLVERESKFTTSGTFRIENLRNQSWAPVIADERGDLDTHEEPPDPAVRTARKIRRASSQRRKAPAGTKLRQVLVELGPGTHGTTKIAEMLGVQRNTAWKQLQRAEERGEVMHESGGTWRLAI